MFLHVYIIGELPRLRRRFTSKPRSRPQGSFLTGATAEDPSEYRNHGEIMYIYILYILVGGFNMF
jgi:hypothetical protein